MTCIVNRLKANSAMCLIVCMLIYGASLLLVNVGMVFEQYDDDYEFYATYLIMFMFFVGIASIFAVMGYVINNSTREKIRIPVYIVIGILLILIIN